MTTFALNMCEELLQTLREAVEKKFGRHLVIRSDFDALVSGIEMSIHEHISDTTIRRFWGYQKDQNANTSMTTLNILSRYCGYSDFTTFRERTEAGLSEEDQSHFTESLCVYFDNIRVGQQILLSWQPNRVVTVEYQGSNHFKIVKSINSKLQEGIEFECPFFLNGEPLTLVNLTYNGQRLHNYICGVKDGVYFKMLF